MNPFSGIISSDLKGLFTNMIDSLLEDTALTVPVRFIYSGAKFTKCPNCNFNSVTGKSANTYLSNGPQPFSHGSCPFCSGDGRIPAENDDEIMNLAVLWDYRKWMQVGQVVASPEGMIQTICSIALINRIKRAKEIVVNTNLEAYVRHKFIREGEPTPIGFGDDQYIVCMWKRSG